MTCDDVCEGLPRGRQGGGAGRGGTFTKGPTKSRGETFTRSPRGAHAGHHHDATYTKPRSATFTRSPGEAAGGHHQNATFIQCPSGGAGSRHATFTRTPEKTHSRHSPHNRNIGSPFGGNDSSYVPCSCGPRIRERYDDPIPNYYPDSSFMQPGPMAASTFEHIDHLPVSPGYFDASDQYEIHDNVHLPSICQCPEEGHHSSHGEHHSGHGGHHSSHEGHHSGHDGHHSSHGGTGASEFDRIFAENFPEDIELSELENLNVFPPEDHEEVSIFKSHEDHLNTSHSRVMSAVSLEEHNQSGGDVEVSNAAHAEPQLEVYDPLILNEVMAPRSTHWQDHRKHIYSEAVRELLDLEEEEISQVTELMRSFHARRRKELSFVTNQTI